MYCTCLYVLKHCPLGSGFFSISDLGSRIPDRTYTDPGLGLRFHNFSETRLASEFLRKIPIFATKFEGHFRFDFTLTHSHQSFDFILRTKPISNHMRIHIRLLQQLSSLTQAAFGIASSLRHHIRSSISEKSVPKRII